MTRQSNTPAWPAVSVGSSLSDGVPQRIELRHSVAVRAALTVFVLIASLAVYSCLASHLGAWQAVPLAFAAAALLTFLAVKHEAARPVALGIGPQGLSAWDRAGRLVAQGRIAGCSQWSSRLLVLALAPEQGRPHTLLVAADALPRPVFRELAVRGRHAAGA